MNILDFLTYNRGYFFGVAFVFTGIYYGYHIWYAAFSDGLRNEIEDEHRSRMAAEMKKMKDALDRDRCRLMDESRRNDAELRKATRRAKREIEDLQNNFYWCREQVRREVREWKTEAELFQTEVVGRSREIGDLIDTKCGRLLKKADRDIPKRTRDFVEMQERIRKRILKTVEEIEAFQMPKPSGIFS